MVTINPYTYPNAAHKRRHHPSGYSDYSSYFPWVQDEFLFRCVYCLKRMVWHPTDVWTVDHLVPRETAPQLACEYTNLVLACSFCNSQKGEKSVPDPCSVAYGKCLSVQLDGSIVPHGKHGKAIIDAVRLNHPRMQEERVKTIKVLHVLAAADPDEYVRRMTYPTDLPDLSKRHPPVNLLPNGVDQSCHARKSRNELSETY